MYTRMAVESFKLWKELERESGQQLMITTGLLMVEGSGESANRFNKTSYETLKKLGLGAEELDRHALKQRFPQFAAENGFFDPHGGVLLASKAVSTFRDNAEANKVRFLRARAQKIHHLDGSQLVELDSGQQVKARKLIVTIGPWSNNILRTGLTRISPTRQQSFYFRPRTNLEDYRPASFPVFFTDDHYGLPAAGIDGVKVSPKELAEKTDPDNTKRSVDEDQVESCRNVCRKYIPGLADGDVVYSRVCLYDMTDNTDFVIDKDPENPGMIYGYGFSGHGFKFAPLIGKLLAQLALGEEPSFNLERFTIMPYRRRIQSGGQLGKDE